MNWLLCYWMTYIFITSYTVLSVNTPSPRPTTAFPTPQPTTAFPTPQPTTAVPSTAVPSTAVPTTAFPTPRPTTAFPTPRPTTAVPTPRPTTAVPTPQPTTAVPTPQPTTAVPSTAVPSTTVPTTRPTTAVPTTAFPTPRPTTAFPTPRPTTAVPTTRPTSAVPSTAIPSFLPTPSPTNFPSLSPHSIAVITTIAGTGTASYSGDKGQATSATINIPCGIVLDSSGNVYFNDFSNHRMRKITVSTGIITTFAGSGSTSDGGDGGAASSASLFNPSGLGIDTSGNLYIGDSGHARVRKITISTNIITTIAGTGVGGYSGDNGLATKTKLLGPVGVALDTSGTVYICDSGNHRVRKVDATTGIMTTLAGSGQTGYSGDGGAATSATIRGAIGINLDSARNAYFADLGNNAIRKVTVSTGIISTVAGTGSTSGGYNGDNIQATSARLNEPHDVVLDDYGNMYICDRYNNRVRKVTVSTGVITTIVGTGTSSSTGDGGSATSATIIASCYSRFDSFGNYYISECDGDRIRKVVTVSTEIPTTIPTMTPSGTPSVIPTAAPSSKPTFTPTATPSLKPTKVPTVIPTSVPSTLVPSYASGEPTPFPTTAPPTVTPSEIPTEIPTEMPSEIPTEMPTEIPSELPTEIPTTIPTTMPTVVPTAPPTVTPTTKPTITPTNVPSFRPTTAPSSFPTYTSSVRVYFMVTQGLTGISAATYSANKTANDAIFKYTVVKFIGYDSKVEDVTIESVTDLTSVRTRRLAAAETKVIYTYTASTQIFNDTNRATDLFMRALNNSIISGAFDHQLHTIHSDTWRPVVTQYATFSTAAPTSSPTSTPTSAPTEQDSVLLNIFDQPLTDQVAKAKIDYYLGAFVGYFVTIYVLLYMYSFLHYGKVTATQLYDSSYESRAYIKNSAATSEDIGDNVPILSDLYVKNAQVQGTKSLEEKLQVIKTIATKNSALTAVSERLDTIFALDEEHKYDKGYREYMHQQRTLLGCASFLYSEGFVVKIPYINREIVFPPGRMEDLLLYICHNHPLFSCFYFMNGSKLGAHGTRILYIGKDVAVFVLYQFSNMLLQHLALDGLGLGTFINLFVITPSAVSVGLVLKYLYTCPFTETVDFQRRYAKYQSTVILLGRLAIVPIMFIMTSSLIIACLFSTGRSIPMILVDYFIYVQFYGILLAIAKAVLLFMDGYYYHLILFGVFDILHIGRLYKERILAEKLVVNVDYAYRDNTYFFGLVREQKILNRDDAIKAKWITARVEGDYDIEMKGGEDVAVVENPLMKAPDGRTSTVFSMDGIFGKEEDDRISYTSKNDILTAKNPIHDTEKEVKEVAVAAVVDDDDAALYLEYTSRLSYNDDAYSMRSDDDATISFDEWKTRKREFKQGTRGSFVKAFQVFEEREKVIMDSNEVAASPSVKNTMHLHSFKFKTSALFRPK